MKVGIPREVHAGERRVAATPDSTRRLIKLGFEVLIESQAGLEARFTDAAYVEAGATIVPDARALWSAADLVLKVRPPTDHPTLGVHEAELLREGGRLICLIFPAQNAGLLDRLAARRATVLALDAVPRISRAQKMDVLSSMANIAGYRAIIEAANHYGGFFTGQITAAGKVPPAKVLIIGAGVAGLAAIGAARSLGAIVRAFDVRPAVREQVQSMGAEFLEVTLQESGEGEGGYAKTMSPEFIAAEMALFKAQCAEVDIVVTTALIPGKPAPKLITADMLDVMREGSVIVDLAAEQGGNCELTVPGQVVQAHGVTVIGYTDLTSRLPTVASQLFASNLCHLLDDMGGATFKLDDEDEAVRGALVLREGQLTWPPPKPKAAPAPAPKPAAAPAPSAAVSAPAKSGGHGHGHSAPPMSPGSRAAMTLAATAIAAVIGFFAPSELVQHLTVFILSCFIGWQVVWSVTPALHTPLMSVTNAISGIIIVGGLLQAGTGGSSLPAILGAVAIAVASVNVAGGFLVTQRMLRMFQK